MEKFYIIGSILISGALTIPPYAADEYGYVEPGALLLESL